MPTLYQLPENHSLRFKLHNEVHARSSIKLSLPFRASHFALKLSTDEKNADRQHLALLCERYGVSPPGKDIDHFSANVESFQFRWEQHSEFSTYTFYVAGDNSDAFTNTAMDSVPVDWMTNLPGKIITAAHAAIMPASEPRPEIKHIASHYFSNNSIVGAEMTGGAAQAFTDFQIHADGFSRFMIFDQGLQSSQAGRLLQRLFEIEDYRIMALLALPIVRQLTPKLNAADKQLISITTNMSQPDCNDTGLLDELSNLAAEIEYYISSTHYRTSAAKAYSNIVNRHIEDLREVRIQGIQTIREFMKRRLEPAINTCMSTAKRLTLLSERTSNAGQLLRTRVDITIERQNQALLTSMNKRAKMQLRLQQTVESLSIVAITTYVASLINYVTKAMSSYGWPIDSEIIVGISIPVIMIVVAITIRRIHKLIQKPVD